MTWLRSNRLLPFAGLLFLVVALGGEAYYRLLTFSGEIRIGLGKRERTVVRAAAASSGWKPPSRLGLLRGVGPGDIPFEEPAVAAACLDTKAQYDAVALPFSFKLNEVAIVGEFPAENKIKIRSGQEERSVDAAPGANIDIDGVPFTLEIVRKWSGLLRDPGGGAMAEIRFKCGGQVWSDSAFVRAGAWQRLNPGIAVRLHWHDLEGAAREAAEQAPPGIDAARWGVVDGDAVSWFESFEPGTGAQTASGADITLVRLDEAHPADAGPAPAIEVRIAENGATRSVWVLANAETPDVPVRFEHFGLLHSVWRIEAWRDGAAWVAAFRKGQPAGTAALQAGQSWRPDAEFCEFRLEQTLSEAVPVLRESSTLFEAVLRGSDGMELDCRQGEAVRSGDALVEFSREAPPPVVNYRLAAVSDDGDAERPLRISPNERVRLRDWHFSQAPPGPNPRTTATLLAEYGTSVAWPKVLFALSLALLVWPVLHPDRPARRQAQEGRRMDDRA